MKGNITIITLQIVACLCFTHTEVWSCCRTSNFSHTVPKLHRGLIICFCILQFYFVYTYINACFLPYVCIYAYADRVFLCVCTILELSKVKFLLIFRSQIHSTFIGMWQGRKCSVIVAEWNRKWINVGKKNTKVFIEVITRPEKNYLISHCLSLLFHKNENKNS